MDLAGMKRRELQALCKRHGLSAGGSNADLVARLDAALSGAADAAAEVAGGVPARKGCLKQTGGDAAEAKKVTFAAEEGKASIWSPVVPKKRGKSAQASADSAAEDGISAEGSADGPVRRSRRNSVSAAEAEEVGEAVAVDRKRKRKNQENDEGVAVSAQVGVSTRVTRSSSLAGAAAALPPAVEKKRGRGKAAGGSNKLVAEVQGSEPDVQKSAQVEVSARITRSRTTAPVVTSPTVVENKRRKTGDAQTNVEQSTVSDVPANNAPVIRSLRNRAVQVNNTMVDETHTARQLENKSQPSRPPTRRRQQVSSSVEGKNQEQIAAPNKAPLLRRSGRNYSEDAEKQPAVKEPVRQSTRNSVVLANDLIEQKNPEAHVRRSMRKSIVPVKDITCIGEGIQNACSEDAAKQPATKRPVRGSRHKSVVSELHEKEKGLIAEKNIEAHEGKSMWKPVMPVKDIKAVGEGIKSAKGKDVEKQFAVKQPTRRSSRKSVLPDMLENNNGLLATEMNAKVNDRRSTRKSVLPNMLNEENQDHNKMSRSGNFQSGKCQDDEREQEAKEPIRRSRRSVATVPLEEQNNGFHEEKTSKTPMRRSTRKSVALNAVEKVSMDHTEVGEEGLKLRKHRRSLLEISSSANDSWKHQNAQIPNEKDNTGGTQQTSNCTASKGRSSKRRRTTATEEVMSVKVANDDIVIMEATKDAHRATHEYNESSSKVQEICQVNATKEEFSSGPLLVTVALTDEICTAQSVPVVIPGPESGDNANECSDKSKQPQEHYDTQAVDSHLSETRSGKLDQSTCIAGLVPRNCVISEDKALLSEDGLSINFTIGDREEQSPSSGEGRVGLEANASEPGEKNLVNVMYTGLHAKSLQHDIDIIAEETDKDVLPMAFPIEEHGEKYAVSPVAVEKSVGWEASARESAGKPLTGIFSNDLHTKNLQHDCDVLTNETGEASGAALPISESDTNPETQCNAIAEESIRAADLGKCPGRASRGNPYSTSLHLEGVADDSILPVLNDDKGCSSDGRPSSFGLELLFAEACKERYSKNVEDEDVQPTGCDADKNLDVHQGGAGEENTAVEIDGGNKPSTPITPGFHCMEDVTEEEVLAQEKCNDQHIPSKTNLKIKLNDELVGPGMESGCTTTEKNERFIAENLDQQAIMQVQLGDVQEGDLKKPSLCSATPDIKHECGLPEENTATEIDGGNKPRVPVTPGIYVGSDCLENEDLQPTGCGADKKLDVDQSVAGDENTDVTPGFFVGSDRLEDEDVQPTRCDAVKKLDVDQGVVEEDGLLIDFTVGDHEEQSPVSGEGKVVLEANTIKSAEKNLAIGIVAEETGKDVMPMAFTIEGHREIDGENGENEPSEDDDVQPTRCDTDKKFDVDQDVTKENTAVEIDGGNKPSTPVTPVTNLSPAEEEVLAQEKCNDQHVPAKTDLKLKLNDELVGPCMESGCSIFEKNEILVADNLDQEGDFKKPSLCSATPEWKHECGLPEETVPPSKNMGSLPSAEHSPFGLESLFSQESVDESVGHGALASATAHTENGFDDSKDCHVKSALENAHVSEPFSHHDTKGGISKNVDCMHTSQQDNGMEGLPEANPDEERVLSAFSLDAKHIKEVINSEEVACEGEGSKELLHSEDLKASSEKTYVNGTDGNAYGIGDIVLSSALHAPADDNYEICLGSNTDVLCQVHNDRCSDGTDRFASKPWSNDIIEDASAEYIENGVVLLPDKERSNLKDEQLNSKLEGTKVVESGLYFNKDIGNILDSGSVGEITPGSGLSKYSSVGYRQEISDGFSMEASLDGTSTCGEQNVCRVDAIENPSVSLATPGCKHEGALSEEAVCTIKNYVRTCSSNPREIVMELQSLFSKENIKESDPHDSLAFPSAENSADESIIVEQQVKVPHGSNLSQLGSTDLLDEPIGCSNTEVLRQCHNHKDQSNEDRVEQVVSVPCTNDIVEAAAAAKYRESGVVLLPSEERSNLNDGELNPKLESPNIMGSGLNCDKDVCNTSDNGSFFAAVGKRTPSGSGLPEDYPKDHYPQRELLDGFSVESSLQGSIFGKKIASGVAGIVIPSLSSGSATPDYKHEDALSEETVRRTKNYIGTCSVDPRHLLMELQSHYSEGSSEKSDLQDNLEFPSAESGRDESIICHVEKLVDTHDSSEPTCQGPCQDLGRHEKRESCMSLPMQAKESGGFLRSSHMKGSVTSSQIDLADDAHLIERDIVAAKQVFCEEKAETKSMPSSDSDIVHEKSYSNGHADQAACASETQFYHSQKTSICDGLHLGPSSLQLESVDALDNDVLYVNTVLEQHHKEGYYEQNVYQVNSGICAMSEAAPVKVLETGIDVETPSLPDEHLNPELDGDEAKTHSLNCETDTSRILGTGSVMSKTALLPMDGHTIYCQELHLPNDLSSFEFAEESAICQDESVSRSGNCQSRSQKCILEANSRLSSWGTELLHQDHKECDQPNEDKFSPKALVGNMSEEGPIEGMESAIMLPLVAGTSKMPDELLNTKMSDESEELSFSCDKDTIENFCTGSSKRELYPLPKDSNIDSCQKQEVPELLSSPKSPEESAKFQCVSVSGSGPCQQYVNESTSMQVTDNIKTLNQYHEEYNQNNEDHTTSAIPASSVPEAVEIEQTEMEIGLIPAAEASVLLPDEQLNNKLEGNEVYEDKDFSSLSDTGFQNREASDLHKDDCRDLSSEDNHPNDLPAPRSPEQSAYFQNNNDSVSGSCQSSRRRGIDELRAKLQSFTVSSNIKGSYIATSAPRPKPGDSMSQSAIALLRNIENTTAVKAGHTVRPNADGKDSSRRALQPISGRPREQ